MRHLSISRAWDETRAIVGRDGRLLVAVALALLVLPQAVLGAFTPVRPADATAGFFGLFLLVLLLAVIAQIALVRLAVPPDATVAGAIKRGVQRLFPAVAALLLVSFAVALVFIVLAVVLFALGVVSTPAPGAPPSLALVAVMGLALFIVFSIFQLVIPVSAAEEGGPLGLISRAWGLGRSSYWRLAAFLAILWTGMLLFWLLGQLIAGLAVAAVSGPTERGGIGAILVSLVVAAVQAAWTIVASVMLARIYLQLAGPAAAEASVPSTGT